MLLHKLKNKIYIFSSIMLLLLLLSACEGTNGDTQPKENLSGSTYTTKVDNENFSNEKFETERVIPMDGIDDFLSAQFESTGKSREMVMTIFYDYVQVPFKVKGEYDFKERHLFQSNNKETITIDFNLDSSKIIEDDKFHKLLVSFSVSESTKAMDVKEFTSVYGVNSIYNIYYTNKLDYDGSQKREVWKPNIDLTIPSDVIPEFMTGELIFNSDKDSNPSKTTVIKFPENPTVFPSDSDVELVYNVSNYTDEKDSKALVIFTLNNKQVEINGSNYMYLDVPKGGIVRDTLKFHTPKEKGFYEVIGFIMFDPWSSESNGITSEMAQSSVRFTMEVK